MSAVARRVVLEGRVQGVGFRWFARRSAERLGVVGWVRNRSDGTVEAHVEGGAEPVGALLERLRRGPPGARVDTLREAEVAAEGLDRFEVRRG